MCIFKNFPNSFLILLIVLCFYHIKLLNLKITPYKFHNNNQPFIVNNTNYPIIIYSYNCVLFCSYVN